MNGTQAEEVAELEKKILSDYMTFRRASDVIEVNCPSQDSEAHSQLRP
jgi:hypothetical protein